MRYNERIDLLCAHIPLYIGSIIQMIDKNEFLKTQPFYGCVDNIV